MQLLQGVRRCAAPIGLAEVLGQKLLQPAAADLLLRFLPGPPDLLKSRPLPISEPILSLLASLLAAQLSCIPMQDPATAILLFNNNLMWSPAASLG